MKRFILAPILMLLLLIAAPDAARAGPKGKSKARSGAVKRSIQSSSSLTWIGDISAPKYMLNGG